MVLEGSCAGEGGGGGPRRAKKNYWDWCCVRRAKADCVIFMGTGLDLWEGSKKDNEIYNKIRVIRIIGMIGIMSIK